MGIEDIYYDEVDEVEKTELEEEEKWKADLTESLKKINNELADMLDGVTDYDADREVWMRETIEDIQATLDGGYEKWKQAEEAWAEEQRRREEQARAEELKRRAEAVESLVEDVFSRDEDNNTQSGQQENKQEDTVVLPVKEDVKEESKTVSSDKEPKLSEKGEESKKQEPTVSEKSSIWDQAFREQRRQDAHIFACAGAIYSTSPLKNLVLQDVVPIDLFWGWQKEEDKVFDFLEANQQSARQIMDVEKQLLDAVLDVDHYIAGKRIHHYFDRHKDWFYDSNGNKDSKKVLDFIANIGQNKETLQQFAQVINEEAQRNDSKGWQKDQKHLIEIHAGSLSFFLTDSDRWNQVTSDELLSIMNKHGQDPVDVIRKIQRLQTSVSKDEIESWKLITGYFNRNSDLICDADGQKSPNVFFKLLERENRDNFSKLSEAILQEDKVHGASLKEKLQQASTEGNVGKQTQTKDEYHHPFIGKKSAGR